MLPSKKSYLRIQKQFSRKINDIEYYKYVVVLPNAVIKEMVWKDKMVLKIRKKITKGGTAYLELWRSDKYTPSDY